jgi:hypothetical protein
MPAAKRTSGRSPKPRRAPGAGGLERLFLTDSPPAPYIPPPPAPASRGGCGGVAQLVRAAES